MLVVAARGSANGTVLQHRPQRLLVLQLVLQLKKPNILQLYPVAIVSGCTVSGCSFHLYPVTARPPKKPNCIRLHCIRLQKIPSVLQLYPVAMYPVAIVSGCSCIRLYLARLCTCISIVSCIRLQLYLVNSCIRLQLYLAANILFLFLANNFELNKLNVLGSNSLSCLILRIPAGSA